MEFVLPLTILLFSNLFIVMSESDCVLPCLAHDQKVWRVDSGKILCFCRFLVKTRGGCFYSSGSTHAVLPAAVFLCSWFVLIMYFRCGTCLPFILKGCQHEGSTCMSPLCFIILSASISGFPCSVREMVCTASSSGCWKRPVSFPVNENALPITPCGPC